MLYEEVVLVDLGEEMRAHPLAGGSLSEERLTAMVPTSDVFRLGIP